MQNIDECLTLCTEMFVELGANLFSRKLMAFIETEGDSESLEALYKEFELLLQFQEDNKKKKRMFTFGSVNDYMVSRFFIVSVKKKYSGDGEPILMINEMQDEITLKDNPIKNLKLIYEDEDDRDRDYEKLKKILE